MYEIRSKVYLSDTVLNTQYKFGEASNYIPFLIVCRGGQKIPAMLTRHDLQKAVARMKRNIEDVPLKKGFWVVIVELLRRLK